MADYRSLRERDRERYRTQSAVPARKRRKVKVHPVMGIACKVKSPDGVYYDYDDILRILFVNYNPELNRPHTFPSRNQASGAIFRTIERWLHEGGEWEGKQFVMENVGP